MNDKTDLRTNDHEEGIFEIEQAKDRVREDREDDYHKTQMAGLNADISDGRAASDKEPKAKQKTPFPEGFEERYYTKTDKERTTVFADSKGEKELFRDTGDKLNTKVPSDLAVAAMIETASHREWDSIKVRGNEDFKREVWLEASARGINVKGFKPNELDMQELKNREQLHLGNEIQNETPEKESGTDKTDPIKKSDEPTVHERGETRSGMPERDANEQAKREAIEAVIERDVRKEFPNQLGKINQTMKYAREHLDERELRGEKLPDMKVLSAHDRQAVPERSPQDISGEQLGRNTKRQDQNRDIEKSR